MSTQSKVPDPLRSDNQPTTIKVISHTSLIYWWPVWLVGFILAGLTYADGTRLAVLPAETTVKEIQPNKVYELTLPRPPTEALVKAAESGKGQDAFPVRIARSQDYGMVDIVVLLLVIFGSNVPLRGLASIIAIRPSARHGCTPDTGMSHMGFRCVLSAN